MKKLYFLLFFAYSFIANGQIVNIPDANFKAKLLSANSSNSVASIEIPQNSGMVQTYNTIDLNNNGEIELSEALNITYLDLRNSSINDLTGINEFTNLISLNASNNILTNLLDISNNLNLKFFACSNNQINNVDISSNINLVLFNCSLNQLNQLDVSENVNLETLIFDSNQISNLNLSQNIYLELLSLEDNLLSEIDLSNNIFLTDLYIDNNQITSLDLNNNSNLYFVSSANNPLINLYIKNNIDLFSFGGFDFDGCDSLEYICCDEFNVDILLTYFNNYGFSNFHINTYCSFTPGGVFYEISGNTKFDLDNNGCDLGDIDYLNFKFEITDGINSGNMIANTSDDYYIPVQAGNHTVTPVLENPSYFTISPPSFVVDFPTDASPFTQDFCVTANGMHSDVEIMVMPTIPARPGFDADYKIIYRNKGNQVENGSVVLNFDDSVLDYLSSNPVYDTSATNTFTWNYTNLQPFESGEIEISFNVNSPIESPAVNIDDILNYTATISTANTDETPDDNTFTLNQTVVGSYDPNDKTCLEGETVDVATVGKYVHYVIRFENTGTYPAENIVVKDMIDISKFDISTLVPLHGSHEFFTRINGNKVEFIFENINLDFNDATNDGYVVFKIKTLPILTLGQTFSNDANIYFDYNFPITTNEYVTTIDNVLNDQDFSFENEFVLYPNPARDILNISIKNQTEIQSVEIYNIVGQVVIAIPNTTNKIDVSSLETGTYFLKVNTEKGSTKTKFVKE